MINILCPTEIEIPLNGYGKIEKIAYDLFITLKKAGFDVRILGNVKEETNDMKKLTLDNVLEADRVIDFTHFKQYAPFFNKNNYIAVTFLTDQPSYVFDTYPSLTVRSWMRHIFDGPVVEPGIDDSKYIYRENKENFLLFVGRLSKIKRPDIAIKVAKELNVPLVIIGHAGKFAQFPDPNYVNEVIEMAKKEPKVELLLDAEEKVKIDYLSRAKALIAPSDWSIIKSVESFGIVAVEALMSGTPVLCSYGGMGEVVIDKNTGYVVRNEVEEYVKAWYLLDSPNSRITHQKCRWRGLYFSSKEYAKRLLKLWNIDFPL